MPLSICLWLSLSPKKSIKYEHAQAKVMLKAECGADKKMYKEREAQLAAEFAQFVFSLSPPPSPSPSLSISVSLKFSAMV